MSKSTNDSTEKGCRREVFDILTMFCDLQDAHDALEGGGGIERWYVEFSGFDGNNETAWLIACESLVDDQAHPRFGALPRGDNFNSHCPVLDSYRRMLEVWKPMTSAAGGRPLTKEQIIAIVSARPHPQSPLGEAMRDPGMKH